MTGGVNPETQRPHRERRRGLANNSKSKEASMYTPKRHQIIKPLILLLLFRVAAQIMDRLSGRVEGQSA